MAGYYRFALTPSFLGHLFKAVFRRRFRHLQPVFARHIAPNATVLDIGANAGQFSKMFSRLASQGQVFAFEPGAYARVLLGFALWANRCRNVTVIPAGLSAAAGCEILHTPVKRGRSLGFSLSHIGGDTRPTLREAIALLTLDGFAGKAGLTRLDFIKADIEGWELHMLQGAKETLSRFHPVMIIELNADYLARAGHTLQQAWEYLEGLGYLAHAVDARNGLTPLASPQNGDIWWLPAR